MRTFTLLASLCAFTASAQDFDAANKSLAEKSYTRACDAFTAFLKANPTAPNAREATAKRLDACLRVGKANYADFQKMADTGEKDFARAYALAIMHERGERTFEQATPILEQAAEADGRVGVEAKALLVRVGFMELERNSYDPKRSDAATNLVLKYASTAEQSATAHYKHALSRFNTGTDRANAEKEISGVAEGSSSWADDAVYLLAQQRENAGKYTDALKLYDSCVSRFSPQTSNMRSSCESQAANIRRPYVGLGVSYSVLPGVKPEVSVNWRNVKNATYRLLKIDPMSLKAQYPDEASEFLSGDSTQVSTWNSTFEVAAPYTPGSKSFEVDVKEPGAYVLEVKADGQSSREWLLISQVAAITKTDHDSVSVFVSDVETGQAMANADVVLYPYSSSLQRQTAKTDSTGVVRFSVPEKGSESFIVWAKSGAHYALARAGSAYWSSWSREFLSYTQTDRPLYKPGETVGLKLYLRTREGGPSTPLANRAITLRVTDPQGKNVIDQNLTTNEFGSASSTLALPKNAALGAYRVWTYATDQSFQQRQATFQVEEYKPPEYSVTITPDTQNAKPGAALTFKVNAKYFSGGAVANAQGRALVRISPWQHTFGAWPEAKFDDEEEEQGSGYGDDYEERPYRRGRGYGYGYYGPIAQHTLTFKTGADGTATVQVPALDLQNYGSFPGLEYGIDVFVTDASRREIQGSGKAHVSAAEYFVDVMAEHAIYKPGEKVKVKLRAEDANGRPVDSDVVVRLMRLSDQGAASKIGEARTKLKGGTGFALVDADALGEVRVEVADAAKPEAVLAQTELWLTSDTKPMAPSPRGFQLYVDKGPLKVGQTVRALVVANRPQGHVWITIESDTVNLSKSVELLGRARFVELPISAAMAPNCALMAMRFEDASIQQQQRQLRVAGSEVDLGVAVGFDRATAEPGSTLPVTVRTTKMAAGTPSEVALTIVDEALFAIAPEARDFMKFFGRHPRQMSVRTESTFGWRYFKPRPAPPQPIVGGNTSFDRDAAKDKSSENELSAASGRAMGPPASAPAASKAVAAEAEAPAERAQKPSKREASKEEAADDARMSGVADMDTGADKVKARTDFGSSAGWYASLASKTGQPLTQSVKLTDSLTSWRATATVITNGPNLGQGSGTLRTAKALMVRLQAPRFFVEGDEVVLSAVIESHLAKQTDVDVDLVAAGFTAMGPMKKKISMAPDSTVRFDARVKVVALGDRLIRAVVRGGGSSDAMEWTLPAFVHGSAQRVAFSGRMKDSVSFKFELPQKRKPELTNLDLTITPTVLGAMLDGLPYLAQYPYGCVEQTLSRFVPATIARKTVKDLNLSGARVPANLDDMVQKGLERLYSFQHGDGGWGWWQSDTTNLWMTAYVVYALGLAKEAGVAIDDSVVTRGRTFLTSHLGQGLNSPETHAFMTYALAKTGGAPKAALDTLYERRTGFSNKGRALVALALLAAKDGRARVAVENLDDVVKAAAARADASVGDANDVWSTSEAIEATALTLMAMAKYDGNSPNIAPLTDFLVLRRNGGKWRTTRDTAFAVYALNEVAKREKSAASTGSVTVLVNGKAIKTLKYAKGGVEEALRVALKDSDLVPGQNVVELRRDGGGTGYFGAIVDVFNQNDFIKGVGGDVKVKRTYTLLGKVSTEKGSLGAEYGMPVESGVRMRVDLELTANKAVEYVMIEDFKPAGFEAVQLRSGPEVCNYQCAHAELRTDRVALFLSAIPVGTTKLSYELRAEVPGKYSALPARTEAMYAPELQATADEMRFEVRDAPTNDVAHQ